VLVDSDAELSPPRALLRDLIALSAMPGGWIGKEPRDVAAGLADALVGLLQLDFGFVRLCDPGGTDAVDVTSGSAWRGFSDWLEHHLATGASFARKEIVEDVGGGGSQPCVGIAIPIGVNGEGGIVAAACDREDFPNESDELLLSLASNQAAIAFQSARVIFERTAELRRSEMGLSRLLTEQRALRRVATLAARQGSQAEIFTALAESTGDVMGVEGIGLLRAEEDGSAVVVALWGVSEGYGIGYRIRADEESVTTRVLRTGRAARVDNLDETTSGVWALARSRGVRSVVWAPVIVEGRTWGVMSAGTTGPAPMPPDTESRLARFTDLMATAIANSESRARVERLLAEQQALRRVATLAARQAPQAEIFNAIAESAGRLLEAEVGLLRRDEDGSAVMVAVWGAAQVYRVGFRLRDEGSVTARVLRTGRPARVDNLGETDSSHLAAARLRGLRSVVWAPVIVEGRIWGVMSAGTTGSEPMPPDTESRLGEFTELMATAIANSESRARVNRLAGVQAALRRVATLAAHEVSQEEVFTAIAESSGELLGSECSGLMRREADGSGVVLAAWGDTGAFEPGARLGAEDDSVTTRVFRTGEPVRIDELDEARSDLLRPTRALGLRSAVGTPLTVGGRVWGAIVVGSTSLEPMPPDTEPRLGEFAELMATAIANSESRARANRLTDAQAALRRMAILVAEDAPLADVLVKAAEEAAHLIGDVDCGVCRDDGDGSVVTAGAWGQGVLGTQAVGERFPLDGISLAGRVLREGRYCLIDDYSTATGRIGERGIEHGIRSAAGYPIILQGRAWGMIGVARYGDDPLPPETEARLAQLAGLVATAIANADARAEIERLAREQAALRRVATLVATDPPLSAEVFAKIAEEVTQAIGGVDCALARAQGDMTITTLGASGTGPLAKLPVGERFRVDGTSIVARVLHGGRPCRIDDYSTATDGEIGERGRQYGIRSAAGCPIIVHGDVWGVISVATYAEDPLPRETERRLAQFTGLVATAIANADARAEVERLAEEQAALRRVATLVAERASPEAVFAKVTEEVGRLVDADVAAMARYQDHDTARIVAAWGKESIPVGLEFPVQDGVTSRVGRSKRSARIEDYGAENVPAFVRDMGVRSAAGAPIVVAGRVWGALLVGSYTPSKWARDAESQIEEFTELAATAVSNMQGQADLAASRARIITSADEARRRIERDLHDGVQQRLVSLALTFAAPRRWLRPAIHWRVSWRSSAWD
jgi:GAF domain-containing protein